MDAVIVLMKLEAYLLRSVRVKSRTQKQYSIKNDIIYTLHIAEHTYTGKEYYNLMAF